MILNFDEFINEGIVSDKTQKLGLSTGALAKLKKFDNTVKKK